VGPGVSRQKSGEEARRRRGEKGEGARGRRGLPVGGLAWGWRWLELGGLREQWGGGVEVAHWEPSGEAGAA
jgi:hypothetical protein